MTSVLNEIYSKCLAQENDISKEISKIIKNIYPIDTIGRVKQKVKESLDNFKNSIVVAKNSSYINWNYSFSFLIYSICKFIVIHLE